MKKKLPPLTRVPVLVLAILVMAFAVMNIAAGDPEISILVAVWLLVLGALIYAFGRFGCLPEEYYSEPEPTTR
ncbi:hypothetical protein EXS57_03380 [Candidatus Kaiserbacteria bacterium]|nr:hypothetical protein [Candidatus Kaiserbacteria bacterium]